MKSINIKICTFICVLLFEIQASNTHFKVRDITHSDSLHIMDSQGRIQNQTFHFNPDNFILEIDIPDEEDYLYCNIEISYVSDSSFTIVDLPDNKKNNKRVKKGDFCFHISKGKTRMFQFSLSPYGGVNLHQKCNEFKKKETKGLPNIEKFISEHYEKRFIDSMGNKTSYYLKFYSYPFKNYVPNQLYQLLIRENNLISSKVHKMTKEIDEQFEFKFTNEYNISKAKEKSKNELKTWFESVKKFCDSYDLLEGTFFLISFILLINKNLDFLQRSKTSFYLCLVWDLSHHLSIFNHFVKMLFMILILITR
jgi:hypothetical protein